VGRGAAIRLAVGLLVASSIAGTALALARQPPAWNAKCGDVDCRVERVSKEWRLLDVKRDRDALKLGYLSGGCFRGDARATVTETASTIEIAVDEGEVVAIDAPEQQPVCPADIRFGRLVVRLDAPVRGRRVLGSSPLEQFLVPSRFVESARGDMITLAPRVAGLAAPDARALLKAQIIAATGARRGRVVRQVPAPGKRIGRAGVRIAAAR
jgi:hypothetical protein